MSSIVSCTFRILCVICFVKSILTDESNEGRCPNIIGDQNFSLDKMLGHWYGIQQRNFRDIRCLEVFFAPAVERNLSYYFLYRDQFGAQVRQNLTAISYPNDPATVDGYYLNEDEVQFWGTWVFVYADSSRCFVVVRCDDITGSEDYDGKHHHKVSKLAYCRNSHPSVEDFQPLLDAMKKQGLGIYKMKDFDQENCPKSS